MLRISLSLLFTLLGYMFFKAVMSTRKRLPPGPRRLPIIGSTHHIPKTQQWLTFSKWARAYGSIVYLDVVGQTFTVLNSAKVDKELLDQRSNIYSDRPTLPMANLFSVHHGGGSGYGELFILQPYGDSWRKQRKVIAQDFSPSTVRRYPLQEKEARKLVHGILDNPSTFAHSVDVIYLTNHRRIGTVIIRVTYGHYVTDEEDRCFSAPVAAVYNFSQATAPGTWAVDFIPMLKHLPEWVPGASFLQVAEGWRGVSYDTSWDPYFWCKKNHESGNVLLPNLCSTALEAAEGWPSKEDEETLVWAASTVMGGGLDSNASTVQTFFLAMLLHPTVQHKAQKEIETTIGSDRLPTIEDRAPYVLPYVRSIMAEVFRWNQAAPLGIPHRLSHDDTYNGMDLPKGSLVIPNIWHMLHDPEVYSNPMDFDPDRYQNDAEMEKVTDLIFGFGRRAYPGKAFADGTLFAIASTVLATCEILLPVDVQGNKIVQDVAYTSGTTSFPSPFDCNVKCRSPKAHELLTQNIAK
ncbi:putative monooxygenase [Mycena albidolilacea]|uniref:Monooxygenase n=1 Tax=Mycena albidolilacea TaxID=1033008 RepID=A0AAD6YYV8_9AGAR|nr:putative monooxygenase [Mycena albidolilacea]